MEYFVIFTSMRGHLLRLGVAAAAVVGSPLEPLTLRLEMHELRDALRKERVTSSVPGLDL
jgi:hypothetical protein